MLSLKQITADLENRNLLCAEHCVLLQNMTEINKQVLQRKMKSRPNIHRSPKAYNYVRDSFNTCLPQSGTIGKWLKSVNCNPEFTKEFLDSLKRKASESFRKIVCILIIDEMAIRRHLEWDGNKYHGQVFWG